MSVRIVSTNTSDSAVLSSSDFVATLPVSNLQVEGRGRVARTTNATGSKVINGDFAGAAVVSCFVLYNHNLTSQAQVRLQIWDGVGQTGNLVFDTGNFAALAALGWGEFQWGGAPWGATVFTGWGSAFTDVWFPAVGGLSFRITLSDPTNPAGYLQIKRLLIGSYFEPGVNVSYGMIFGWQDNSEQVRTQGGSLRTDARVLFRKMTADLSALTPAERAIFQEIMRTIGVRKETFISVWPDAGGALERDHAMLCKCVSMPGMDSSTPSSYAANMEFEEV